MSLQRRAANLFPLVLLSTLLFAGGCARQPPNQSTLSGKRLIVDMTFASAVDPNQHYFFLINAVNNQEASGPVPVLTAPYGNGFATGSGTTGTNGFTDYVEFDNASSGYLLYHAVGDPNALSNLKTEGRPVYYVTPDPTDAQTQNKLHFEIDLSQLIYDAQGNRITDQTTVVSQALALKWIQVNIVATNHLAVDATTNADKLTDSIGDNRIQSNNTSFLIIDLSQLRVYRNGDPTLQLVEPTSDYDVIGNGGYDPAIDLRDWTVTVQQQ